MHLKKKCTEPPYLSQLNGLKWFINNAHRTKELTMTIGFDTCMESFVFELLTVNIVKSNIWVNIVEKKKTIF